MSRNQLHGQEGSLRLIRAIQNRPCLWMERDKSYKNSILKGDNWNAVAVEIGESVEVVKKKWRNLTIQYYNNRKAYRASLVTGSDASDIRQPTWYAYEAMSFLEKVNQARRAVNTHLPEEPTDTEQYNIIKEEVDLPDDVIEEPQQLSSEINAIPTHAQAVQSTSSTASNNTNKRRRLSTGRIEDALKALDESLADVQRAVRSRAMYDGVANMIVETMAENKEDSARNAEFCGKMVELCARYRKTERTSIIKNYSKFMESCSSSTFQKCTIFLDNLMTEEQKD